MRLSLDTNILVYAEGVNGDARQQAALEIVSRLSRLSTFIPVQVLGELFRVLTRKASLSPKAVRGRLAGWQASFPLIETSPAVLLAAIDLAVDHRMDIWDAVVLAAAAEAQCRVLLSEDMQDGFTWRGVTVTNPFATEKSELLNGFFEM